MCIKASVQEMRTKTMESSCGTQRHKSTKVLDIHVNPGDTEYSYARNSTLQKSVIRKVMPMLEDTIKAYYSKSFSNKFAIADLGCSSSPNALHAIFVTIETIFSLCKENGHTPPELQVFLNDLPGNDFNHVFRSLPEFYEKIKKLQGSDHQEHCFISGVPGSFYGRLFPSQSLNFVHSSSSLHWLSQVPEGIENNKGNIYMSKTSPSNVQKTYLEQFQKDFTLFLISRGKELVTKGKMILTFVGRDIADPITSDCVKIWDLLAKSLLQLSAEGLVTEADVDSFNIPFYNPYAEEVKTLIQKEGSFEINNCEIFTIDWDPNVNGEENQNYVLCQQRSGQNVAHCVRAALEPLLASHFGEAVVDELIARFAKNVSEQLSVENSKYTMLVFSLSKMT